MPPEIQCAACRGHNVELVRKWKLGQDHHAVACRDCGLLFVHPQPSKAELDAYYAPDGGWQASREQKPRPAQTRTKGGAPAMFEALDRHFPASTPRPGAKVFDFGCGPGIWLNSFQDRGWDTYGLEPANDEAFVRHKRLDAIPSEPQFDLLIVYHVLEHLPRPLEVLEQLVKCLVPGGHCLIGVPRLDRLAVHRDIKYCLHRRNHIVAFTETCMRGLLARAGMETVTALHDLDERFSRGVPLRMRLLARKVATPVALPADPMSALTPVIESFVELRTQAKLAASQQ